jgi:hypothetical protein
VLNLLRGLSPRYGHLKALIKRSVPFPTFHTVRNELLLEELTMANEAPTPASALYSAPTSGQPPSGGQATRPPSTGAPTRRPGGPSSDFHDRRRSSLPQGRPWGWRTLSWWSLRSGWRPRVAVLLQPLDRDHRHVAGPGTECPSSLGAGPPNCTSLRHAPDASVRCAHHAPGSAPALLPPGTPTPTTWSPPAGGWDNASLAAAFSTMAMTPPSSDWVIDYGASYHTTPTAGTLSRSHPSLSSHPSSIVVGNGSTLQSPQ